MTKVQDILIDEASGDVTSYQGDFVIDDSTRQHQVHLLLSIEGEFKQNETTGVGAINFIDDEGPANFTRKVRQQFTNDGMDVSQVNQDGNGQLNIIAEYL
jgi:hypothetical protein